MGFLDKFNHAKDSNQNASSTPVAQTNSGNETVLDLSKKAELVLKKKNASDIKASVYLVLDYSGSMRGFYNNGSVQNFTERVLGISGALDDDGTVPTILFDDHVRGWENIETTNYQGIIDKIVSHSGHMGTTDYTKAMQAVINHYNDSGSTEPALVIFQTDGAPNNKRSAENLLCEAANLPIFWQFVGFGHDEFAFLKKLDDLSVPQKRIIDNADFFSAGANPKELDTLHLYDNLLNEFPNWVKEAKAKGIIRN